MRWLISAPSVESGSCTSRQDELAASHTPVRRMVCAPAYGDGDGAGVCDFQVCLTAAVGQVKMAFNTGAPPCKRLQAKLFQRPRRDCYPLQPQLSPAFSGA